MLKKKRRTQRDNCYKREVAWKEEAYAQSEILGGREEDCRWHGGASQPNTTVEVWLAYVHFAIPNQGWASPLLANYTRLVLPTLFSFQSGKCHRN